MLLFHSPSTKYEKLAKYWSYCIRNRAITNAYSPDVINIQRGEAELNIILTMVNNFDIKHKKTWNICFIICHQNQTRSGKIEAKKLQQILVKTQVFFVKTALQHI